MLVDLITVSDLTQGAIHSTKTYRTFETLAKRYENFLIKFLSRKSEDWRMYEKQTIQPKILEILGTEIPGKKFSKMLVYLRKLSSFPKFSENTVPLEMSGNSNPNILSSGKSAPQFHLARLELITD